MSTLKYYIMIPLLLATVLFGYTPAQIAQAKAAVSANPALLNSPEAKKLLQQKGAAGTPLATGKPQIVVENKIVSDTSGSAAKVIETPRTPQPSSRLNPLAYQSNDKLLKRIKSSQATFSRQKLKRFSTSFFRNRNEINPNRIVVPADYIINKGDILTYWIYGATNQQEELKVDARGNINIPQVGPVHVAGEKFGEVKELLTNYLSSSYKNSQVVIDLNSFSTAQVTVTGFVKVPGLYNTTSVSSVKDILIQAGGVSDVGSVRRIEVRRNGKLIDRIDYYHLLTLGKDHGDTVLQAGDVIHVPKAYGLIAIDGEVNTPAIYEIEPGEKLAHILKIAGGLKAAANGRKIYVKRFNRHTDVEYQTLTLSQARRFTAKDGDEVYIGKLNKSDEHYIEVTGNVVDPGKKYIGSDTIQLSTFLRQQLKGKKLDKFFLENTRFDYAMIKRVQSNTLTPEIYHVNLKSVLDGTEDFSLKNRDILYVFNRLDTEINPYVTIEQAKSDKEIEALSSKANGNTILKKIESKQQATRALLLSHGKFQYTEGMTLADLINMAGVAAPFDQSKVKVVSLEPTTNKATVSIIDYQANPDFALKPFDKVYVFDLKQTKPVAMATIMGEVVKPGQYPVEDGMSLEEYIQSAGGLTQRAYPKTCEIIRYHIENGERKKKIFNLSLDQAKTFIVQAHDEINIKRVPYWGERKKVTIKGQVKFPGTYVVHSGEKLSSLLQRAGGFTDEAFLYGAVFSRQEIAALQKKSLRRSLAKLKEQVILASLRSSGSKTMGQISVTEGISAVQSLIDEAEKITPIGRISISLSCDMERFKNSPSDLTLKDGDSLYIPSFNDTVVVSGEVMNPMALTYGDRDVRDYIDRCGGLTEISDTDHIYVLHANGEAQKASIGSYLFSSNHVKIKRGDVIIVPKKIMFERGIDIAGDIADIVYKLTLTVAAMNTVGVF